MVQFDRMIQLHEISGNQSRALMLHTKLYLTLLGRSASLFARTRIACTGTVSMTDRRMRDPIKVCRQDGIIGLHGWSTRVCCNQGL